MVEQEAVNFEVASSSLAGGAKLKFKEALKGLFFVGRLEPGELFFVEQKNSKKTGSDYA